MNKRIILIVLVLLVPLSTILAAVYELVTGKNKPTLYLLLVAIPGALIAALKSLKELGLLLPSKISFEVYENRAKTHSWLKGFMDSDATQNVTDIIIPIRISNKDSEKAVDILDVNVVSTEAGINLDLPEMQEISVGSQKQWAFTLGNSAFPELFNDGKVKTIEPTKIEDYVIGLREYGQSHERYALRIEFSDNFGRKYSKEVRVIQSK